MPLLLCCDLNVLSPWHGLAWYGMMVWPRVWNYNKGGSLEHLLRGCKEALLSVDGKPIKRCLLRMVR